MEQEIWRQRIWQEERAERAFGQTHANASYFPPPQVSEMSMRIGQLPPVNRGIKPFVTMPKQSSYFDSGLLGEGMKNCLHMDTPRMPPITPRGTPRAVTTVAFSGPRWTAQRATTHMAFSNSGHYSGTSMSQSPRSPRCTAWR
mmetsp:Transcript_27822/g.46286  ORF Transcript_27822/g.46286 Transcript_27822/m.46286 type:complete len:143 (+) Transcript_27822:1-429(+)